NATGFDTTGEPIFIRRASDGGVLYDAQGPRPVALCVARRDCPCYVRQRYTNKPVTVDEKNWVEKYMRLKLEPPPAPKDDKAKPPPQPKDDKKRDDGGKTRRLLPLRPGKPGEKK